MTTESLDALPPAEMARRAETVGVAKCLLPASRMLVLAILAGAFIALGAVFATVATMGDAGDVGAQRVLGGVTFSLGLILVVVGGAELFTGNNLIVMAWAARRVSTRALLRNWFIVYVGNFLGAVTTALIVVVSGHHSLASGAAGDNAMRIADAKVQLGFPEAVLLGVLANALVCLAVWLTMSARSVTDRVLAVVFPIAGFVAAGFEHSVANMYFVPAALFLRSDDDLSYWDTAAQPTDAYPDLTWSGFLVENLIPVTIGNLVGGGLLVAAVYWFVYLAPSD